MANEPLTPQIVAREALIRLKGNLALANEVYRDYSQDFAQVGDTVTVRKPATFVADEFGDSINLQEIGEKKVPVKMDTHLDVSVEATTKEMTMDIKNFGAQVLDGAMLAIAEGINNKIAEVGSQQIPFFTGVAGTTPNTLKLGFTDPMKEMNINKVPNSNRKSFFDPVAQAELLQLSPVVEADKSGSTQALREASMGRIMGFDTYMDQAIKTHTAGAYTALGDVTVTAVSHDSNDYNKSLLTLESAAGTSTDNVLAGDLLTVDGHQYVVISDSSAASAGVISGVEVYPHFHEDTVGDLGSAAVTFADETAGGHVSNLAFHTNAIALVSRPLETPMGKDNNSAYTAVDPNTGLSVRAVMDYDISSKKSVISFDSLFGAKTIFPQLGAQILG